MAEKSFFEQFEENVSLYPNKIILSDNFGNFTFRELDIVSGKVYAFLHQKGIGKEDVVMISLPRGKNVYAVLMGIWKAGACAVVINKDDLESKNLFIYADCCCKYNFTASVFTESQSSDYLSGFELTNPHDAAFIVYTSGSEGHPKGIVHEYGKIEMCRRSWSFEGKCLFSQDDVSIVTGPLNTASTYSFLSIIATIGIRFDFVDLEKVYSFEGLVCEYTKHKCTFLVVPASFLSKELVDRISPRMVIISTEPAKETPLLSCPLYNIYAQTESGFIITMGLLTQQYHNAPIGKPTINCELTILDDNDKPLSIGQIGELCYKNEYTRGYINPPHENADAFKYGLFHSGDLAKILPDGNYLVLGRKSDMVKINGNRIEPAEIEAAVKNILKIDWAVAKGFVSPERSYICVYYTENVEIDNTYLREQLLKVLPHYMVPSYFIHIDEIPRLPNGKVDRQKLLAPDIEQYRTKYVAPTNELEKRICQAMEKVLHLEHIGINDDFYLLGGDSLRTISLVNNLNITDIVVTDIYSSRTPKQIALTWMQKQFI